MNIISLTRFFIVLLQIFSSSGFDLTKIHTEADLDAEN